MEKQYKFKSKAQEDAEAKEKQKLKEQKEAMKGKKLLKEATFTVTTVDDAIDTIQQCMDLIAIKKRNINIVSDLIGSALVGGIDDMALNIVGDPDDGSKIDKVSTLLKKKIMMIIRSSMVF